MYIYYTYFEVSKDNHLNIYPHKVLFISNKINLLSISLYFY